MGRPPVFIMGGSGGIGKSTTARTLACMLASHTSLGAQRVVLVDANLGQQTQRDYHRVPRDMGLERYMTSGRILDSIVTPDRLGVRVPYALLPGPLDPRPGNMDGLWDGLGRALGELSRLCDWTIVDLDKTDGVALEDRDGVCGRVMLPWVDGGLARMVFKLASSPDKLADGMRALQVLRHANATGILGVVTPGAPDPTRDQWMGKTRGLGRFLGVEHWDERSGRMIGEGVVSGDAEWSSGVLSWLGVPVPQQDERGGRRGWFRRR